jgi:Tol biopolymer transport system component
VRFQLETRTEKELKAGAWYIELAVSPDSKQLAYLVQVRPGAASYLALMPAAGGEAREVFRASDWIDGSRYSALSWTPDGRHLVFVRGSASERESVLWQVPAAGGQAEPLGISFRGKIKSPDIHPDGRRIVFGASDNSAGEVWALENFLPEFARR